MTTPRPDQEATARIDSDLRQQRRGRQSDSQFAPGTIIAGRYRIAGILGSGGMGEVYRADDIKLDQAVALKFLPARLAGDPLLLSRLHDEVRLGRQISHPNVCRIYDIAEADGAHFVAMEFVDGEDLSRLLRRIGRLAHDKAVDIARGIAAGLMAAHAKGILHRDLKPANVMIDSHGDSRIMDFGLALAADEDDGTISGTPAYMAPEQIGGQPATVQSDLYALGLVMYELFTGKRAHSGSTLLERRRESDSEITTPSSVIRDLDPAVERIILRCLSNDPVQRPRSARQVIESLPGGDPLAAAMAAGETPSPRIVAAAGTEGSLKPAVAWSLLAAIVVLVAGMIALHSQRSLMRRAGVTRPPEAMADRGQTILRELGLAPGRFRAHGYHFAERYLAWIFTSQKGPRRWDRLAAGAPAVVFWLREEPKPLLDHAGSNAAASPTEPPLLEAGAKLVRLDQRGRLVELTVVPEETWKPRPLNWAPMLAAAGFDPAKLESTEPRLLPPFFADARAAWKTRHPDDGTPIRIEAAALRGTPVSFRIVAPWDEVPDTTLRVPFGGSFFVAGLVIYLFLFGAASFLAWRNIRLRRGDRQGALRVAVAMAILEAAYQLLSAEHELDAGHELSVAAFAAMRALMIGAIFWLLYIALEPFMRRRWPDRLISWSRLLAGNWRDPMIGRDILIGLAAGLLNGLINLAFAFWIDALRSQGIEKIENAASAAAHLADSVGGGVVLGFALMTMLMIFTLILRRRPLAIAALWLVYFVVFMFASTDPRLLVSFALSATIYVLMLSRFGLLAAAAMHFAFAAMFFAPLADDIAWYTATGLAAPAFIMALAVWAFIRSLGGQSAFSASLLDDHA